MGLVAQLYVTDDKEDRRAAPRRSVGHGTTVRLAGQPLDVILHDLSETGASIETSVKLAAGSAVTIGLPGVGRVVGHVVSRVGARYGCQFTESLSTEAASEAFRTNPIMPGRFVSRDAVSPAAAGNADTRWSGAVRIALPLGVATGGWCMMIGFVRRLADW